MSRRGEDEITARDEAGDDENAPFGLDQPISEAEIEELLYNDQIPLRERLEQLRDYRAALRADRNADLGGGDTAGLLAQVEQAINQLRGDADGMGGETDFDDDPLSHRETLSPDDDDLLDLEALEKDEEEEDEEDLVALDGARDEADGDEEDED